MKIDLKKDVPGYRARRGRFEVVTVPPLRFLTIDGRGDPNTSEAYRDAVGALFPLAYALKFFSKRELGRDYGVMPLEALWSADDMAAFTTARDTSRWEWTLLNLVPEWITEEHLALVRGTVEAKARKAAGSASTASTASTAPTASTLDALAAVRLEDIAEGLCVQTLHVGPYDAEGPVLQTMHEEFIPSEGLRMTGRHHEIYLSDVRRTSPEKLRTILRQPVARA